ncbi:dihydrodipicolinate synthetase [Atractiella rhizophila]|nr:dihydrodipicolinate synthetase [Atractiella rhizophila]
MSRSLRPGVFSPVLTFFKEGTEDLDLDAFRKHITRLAKAGMGICVQGTNGEAIHLEPEERVTLIKTAREVLDSLGLHDAPIIAGTGGGSTRETIKLCKQAAEAGADCCLVITPGYFGVTFKDKPEALKAFFWDVADASPIPVMLYNFPNASSGIDLNSDVILSIAEHPNTCGVKLTCAGVGKLVRVAGKTTTAAWNERFPRKNPNFPFLVLGGQSDFLLPGMIGRSSGCITGLGNIAPATIVKLFQTGVKAITTCSPADLKAAQELEDVVAAGDWAFAKNGLAVSKYVVAKRFGYGGVPRRPLPQVAVEAGEKADEAMGELLRIERELTNGFGFR